MQQEHNFVTKSTYCQLIRPNANKHTHTNTYKRTTTSIRLLCSQCNCLFAIDLGNKRYAVNSKQLNTNLRDFRIFNNSNHLVCQYFCIPHTHMRINQAASVWHNRLSAGLLIVALCARLRGIVFSVIFNTHNIDGIIVHTSRCFFCFFFLLTRIITPTLFASTHR